MRRPISLVLLTGMLTVPLGADAVRAAGTWTWPVRGPIVRPYDPPASPYGAGHRGIDIAAAVGTVVLAPAPGVVSFAGRVAGQLFVSIDHGAGLVSTSSYLSATLVAQDDPVVAGQAIGLTGSGHPSGATAHLHFGVRLGGVYVDPMDYLGPVSLVGWLWLAPIGAPDPASMRPTAAPTRGVAGPDPRLLRLAAGLAAIGPRSPASGTRPSWLRGRPVPA
jgi:hypothetical protein